MRRANSRAASQLIPRESVWNVTGRQWRDVTLATRIDQAIEVADDYYGQVARNFGDKVTGALSGGYDSRLNLALLRRHGITPALFVYGGAQDPDVQIARLICRSEALELQHLDRDSHTPLEPADYWRNQEDVFHGLDGLTQYGYACQPYEVSHRRERVAGGLLVVNGGGGEIWRDFWKLPDKADAAGGIRAGVLRRKISRARVRKGDGRIPARAFGEGARDRWNDD